MNEENDALHLSRLGRGLSQQACHCYFIASCLLLAIALPCSAQTESAKKNYAIAIHGGAGGWQNLRPQEVKDIEQGLESALRTGRDLLAQGGSSLDAVEQAIRSLEDCPSFNAGKGSVYNAAGKHQLDASIMNGRDRSAGAVAAIGVARHPISVAKLVMTKSPHVLLTGEGANEFARRQGATIVSAEYFWTEKLRNEWRAKQQSLRSPPSLDHYGTVGCVALDTSSYHTSPVSSFS